MCCHSNDRSHIGYHKRTDIRFCKVLSSPVSCALPSITRSYSNLVNQTSTTFVSPNPPRDLLDWPPDGQLVQLRCCRDCHLDANVFAGSAARTSEGRQMHFMVRTNDLQQISRPVVCGSTAELALQHQQLPRRCSVMHQAVTESVCGRWTSGHLGKLEQNMNTPQGQVSAHRQDPTDHHGLDNGTIAFAGRLPRGIR